ncbi:MAG: hypothetical protein MZV63_03300 [Marinilabiliales bacterium]|nr:hypothetical protein [Marinilabiliales bacterium]
MVVVEKFQDRRVTLFLYCLFPVSGISPAAWVSVGIPITWIESPAAIHRLIKALGIIYTVLITAGFLCIPVYIYFWM